MHFDAALKLIQCPLQESQPKPATGRCADLRTAAFLPFDAQDRIGGYGKYCHAAGRSGKSSVLRRVGRQLMHQQSHGQCKLGRKPSIRPLNRCSRYAIWAKLRRENVAEVGALPVRLQDEIICCRKRLEPSQYPVPHLRMIAQLKTDNGLNGGDLIFQAMRKLFYRKLPKMLLVLQSF